MDIKFVQLAWIYYMMFCYVMLYYRYASDQTKPLIDYHNIGRNGEGDKELARGHMKGHEFSISSRRSIGMYE